MAMPMLAVRDTVRPAHLNGSLRAAVMRSATPIGPLRSVTSSSRIPNSSPPSHAEGLQRQADLAMYRAKAEGPGATRSILREHGGPRARPSGFGEGSSPRARALGIQVHYQRVVALATGRISEAEALIRWSHPQRGLILPAEFIHVLEDAGLMVPVGLYRFNRKTPRHVEKEESAPPLPPWPPCPRSLPPIAPH